MQAGIFLDTSDNKPHQFVYAIFKRHTELFMGDGIDARMPFCTLPYSMMSHHFFAYYLY